MQFTGQQQWWLRSVVCLPLLARLTDSPPSVPECLAQSEVRSVRACGGGSVTQLEPAGQWFNVYVVTFGNPRDLEGGNGTPNDVMSVLLGSDIEDSDENEDSDFFLLRQKKVKTPVVILIVIWETETNPHSDVHKPRVLPSSNALVCVTHGCLYRTVLVGQVT
ncbi:hypothetical protein E2C01_044884 [Portunus trituberculatus]|uniref:Uncharacterized protein n=1 Tax=Portunus trituberculatus TaxID=210409 RepID=A0A5B7G0B7_PORTR|nr:hypothetical protein [Portunus trituberculatus]